MRQFTDYFLQLRFAQLKLLYGLDLKLGLQDCRSSPKYKYLNYCLLRMLRMALFFQCIVSYPLLLAQSTLV